MNLRIALAWILFVTTCLAQTPSLPKSVPLNNPKKVLLSPRLAEQTKLPSRIWSDSLPPAPRLTTVSISWFEDRTWQVSTNLAGPFGYESVRVQVIALDTNSSPMRFYRVPIAGKQEGVNIPWAAPDIATGLASYSVYYGTNSRSYSTVISGISNDVRSVTINALVPGQVYYFSATAQDGLGLETDFSNEVTYTAPFPATNATVNIQLIK